MDTDGVEQVDVNTLGGSDFVEIDDLPATDVTAINVDGGLTLGARAPTASSTACSSTAPSGRRRSPSAAAPARAPSAGWPPP